MTDCLFCRIIRGEIPAKKVYEDEHTFAFEDIDPKAPTHVLVVPKKHIRGLKEALTEDADIIGRCHLAAAQLARQRGIARAMVPSLIRRGTILNISSLVRAMIGSMIRERAMAPAKPEKWCIVSTTIE